MTWEYAGEITLVRDVNDLFAGAITIGMPFSCFFTFESTTPDSSPDNPRLGSYSNALSHVEGLVGAVSYSGVDYSRLVVLNDYLPEAFDSFSLFAEINALEEPSFIGILLRDNGGAVSCR